MKQLSQQTLLCGRSLIINMDAIPNYKAVVLVNSVSETAKQFQSATARRLNPKLQSIKFIVAIQPGEHVHLFLFEIFQQVFFVSWNFAKTGLPDPKAKRFFSLSSVSVPDSVRQIHECFERLSPRLTISYGEFNVSTK